jgi:hypothetical protein
MKYNLRSLWAKIRGRKEAPLACGKCRTESATYQCGSCHAAFCPKCCLKFKTPPEEPDPGTSYIYFGTCPKCGSQNLRPAP